MKPLPVALTWRTASWKQGTEFLSACINWLVDQHKSGSGSLFHCTAVCKKQAAFIFSQKGMVHNIEENKKLYKYLERGKGHLRHQ